MTTRLAVPRGLDERFVRAYVARGSGLASSLVIAGQSKAPTPAANFATVLLVTDSPDGRVFGFDLDGGDMRQHSQYRTATFQVQFLTPVLRAGEPSAVDFAMRFCMWSESDDGLISAEGGLKSDGWPNGTEMRVDHPLSFERIDGIEDDDWEQRALISLACRYSVTYVDSDRRIEHASVELLES